LVLKLISVSIIFQTPRTYQLSGAGKIVGVDGETDLLEEQEAELSADREVVIGKEEIVVGARKSQVKASSV
jgi:hypothetical protein